MTHTTSTVDQLYSELMDQDQQRDETEENYWGNHCLECDFSPCACHDLACDISVPVDQSPANDSCDDLDDGYESEYQALATEYRESRMTSDQWDAFEFACTKADRTRAWRYTIAWYEEFATAYNRELAALTGGTR